jgi:phage shock protein A
LKQTLAHAKQVDQEEYDLIASCIRNKKQLVNLEEQLKEEADAFEQQEKVLDERIYDLKNELQDITVEHRVKLSFVKNWVASRRAEAELALQKQNETLASDFVRSEEELNNEILTADNIKSK